MSAWLLAIVIGGLTVYVSPNGSDDNDGNVGRPLKTLQAARDTVRRQMTAGQSVDAVELADGEYKLTEALVLGKEDSGKEEHPIVWRAANKGKARLVGFAELKDVHQYKDQIIKGTIPENCVIPDFYGGRQDKKARLPLQLFQNGERLVTARWPNEGYAKVGEVVTNDTFRFDSPRLAAWAKERDLWTFGLWRFEWSELVSQVKGIDLDAQTITVDMKNPRGSNEELGRKGQFYILNALCELDQPGEWAVDRASRKVWVWPKSKGAIEIAAVKNLVVCNGVSDLKLSGIIFEGAHSDAVAVDNARRFVIEASTIRRSGGRGVKVANGAQCRVDGCDIYDVGMGGVELEGGDMASVTPAGNVVENCHIHHFGRIFPNYQPGVRLVGVGNIAAHNLIHHTDHQAIAFSGNDHLIAKNVIHDACRYNDDAGAIYACGQQYGWKARGTVIEDNLIHFVGKRGYTANCEAIYLDDWTSGVIVRGNVINRANNGIHWGGGNFVVITNNLFIGTGKSVKCSSRGVGSFAEAYVKAGKNNEFFRGINKAVKNPRWRERYPEVKRLIDMEDGILGSYPIYSTVRDNAIIESLVPTINPGKPYCKLNDIGGNVEFEADQLSNFAGLDFAPAQGSKLAEFFKGRELKLGDVGLYASDRRASEVVRFGEGVTRMDRVEVPVGMPSSRIDIVLEGKLPEGEGAFADVETDCTLLASSKGKRLCGCSRELDRGGWRSFRFVFVPRFGCRVRLCMVGNYEGKTWVDDIQVSGAKLMDGGFEGDGSVWKREYEPEQTISGVHRPWGIIETPFAAAEGKKAAVINHDRRLWQGLDVRKGVPVEVKYMARAFESNNR